MKTPLLVDAGPLVALLDDDDEHHAACSEIAREHPPPLMTCWAAIAEAAWRLRSRPERVDKLVRLVAVGSLLIPAFDARKAAPRIQELLIRYRSIRAQLADVTLLYLADERGTDRIFTLDRRDFAVYRLRRNRRIRIIPEIG